MKDLGRFILGAVASALLGLQPANAAVFSSLYGFGDGVCTTTNNTTGGSAYYGLRFTNGRTWLEVLAEQQGMTYESNKNCSYFGHYSTDLLTNIIHRFPAPGDASTALFVIWVNDADLVNNISSAVPLTNITFWTSAMGQSLTNHLKAVQALYEKGARTLVMPNAVDIARVPFYKDYAAASRAFIRDRVIEYNTAFASRMKQAASSLPGLTIHVPDLFSLLDELIEDPSEYGLVNPGIDARQDDALTDKSLNGPGASYVFWDALDPTAKSHAVIADRVQQLISPLRISQLTFLQDSNRLDLANIPIGRNGFLDASTNLVGWPSSLEIQGTNATQTVLVPASAPSQFYRLRFPFAWSWP